MEDAEAEEGFVGTIAQIYTLIMYIPSFFTHPNRRKVFYIMG